MGKENDVMLEFLRDDRRFADLFNGGLFGGEKVVDAGELEESGENYTEFREHSQTEKYTSAKDTKEKQIDGTVRDRG